MNVIKEMTKDCAREDCSIQEGVSMSTCMGWIHSYDKEGNAVGRDPNYTTTEYNCLVCGKEWVTSTQSGETQVIPKRR